MSDLHIRQIEAQIAKKFKDKIDLADRTKDSLENKRGFFLTRSLAAYAVSILAETDPDISAQSVVDGDGDNGIDAIHYDPSTKNLFLVQSKWIAKGAGTPTLTDIRTFLYGIKDLLNGQIDKFNDKLKAKSSQILTAIEDPATKFEIVLVHTGSNDLAPPARNEFEKLKQEYNDPTEVLDYTILNQADLHNSLIQGIQGLPINEKISLQEWGKRDEPYLAYYGQVNGADLLVLWKKYKKRLFEKNIRSVLGDTDVNNEIKSTILEKPSSFWYFNNGITIVCKKIDRAIKGSADHSVGHFDCEEINIVNGAQTVTTIGRQSKAASQKIYVMARLISLEGAPQGLMEEITKSNNRQNRIENRDFASLDPYQQKLHRDLLLEGINYSITRSEESQKNRKSFDLVDSTTALACASGDVALVVQLKREIGKLWEDINRPPYKQIFNENNEAGYIWNCVRIQRMIDKALEEKVQSLEKRNFGICVHGNRFIAALVFRTIKKNEIPDQTEIDSLVEAKYENLRKAVEEKFENAVLATLFKNLTKSKTLFQVCANS